ncbi:MAG: stage II sporulation protein R [Tepidanaerobacteraceae bacterium]|nr:stage II sporulation protein R [Tepidanaerobacteraceae bacterium]
MRNNLTVLKKTAIVTVGILILSLIAALIGNSGMAGGPENFTGEITTEQLSSKLIRLHIIANSDSQEDQALKLRVRDKIIETLNSEFEQIDNINASRKFIKNNLEYIEKIAREKVQESGKDYDVIAMFGKFPFPAKNYGYVTLPAGEYEALRVIIGSGKGANWWCVLFPPLCFVDITQGTTQEEVKLSMGKVLTSDEMAAIETAKAPNDIPVEVRFKVVEWWKEAKGKINRTIKLAFNKEPLS